MEVKGKYGESKREQTESLLIKGARAPEANCTCPTAWSKAVLAGPLKPACAPSPWLLAQLTEMVYGTLKTR